MTSACGVVIDVNDTNADHTFVNGSLKARGDVFEDFFYGMQSLNITKAKPAFHQYHIGDTIPTKGETYAYPDNFDILILRDKVAVEIRDAKVANILALDGYAYTEQPLVNGRGFAINVHSPQEFAAFKADYAKAGENSDAELFDKWMTFETYRKIKFHNDFE